jgi:hypothetical protein
MDTIRWFFFLSLALLLIASCNTATAQYKQLPPAGQGAAIHQTWTAPVL